MMNGMRCITYAGETLITTDDVAAALVELTASIANYGRAEAITIPIVVDGSDDEDTATLVIGVGNDVLSAPLTWHSTEPDFSAQAEQLRSHPDYPRTAEVPHLRAVEPQTVAWDPDLDGFHDA